MVAAVKMLSVESCAPGSIFLRPHPRRLHVYSQTGIIMQP